MADLSVVDFLVCFGYLAIVFGLAIRSTRGQRDNEDYFVGGRRMPWVVVGVSMFATSFSAISFLGLPQRGAYQDFSFYLTILFIPFVITPILWWLFIPLYVRLKVSSGYEYLNLRFGKSVQRIGSLLYCIYAIGWMGTMLYAIALTLQIVMGLSHAQYIYTLIGLGAFATIYTALGGLKAVIWTDALQAVVLGAAIFAVFLLAVQQIDGGWSSFWQLGSQHSKFQMFHLSSKIFDTENFTSANSVFTAAAFGLFMYLPGYAVAQNMIQRYVCTKGLKEARGVVVLSAVINMSLGLLFMLVGTALYIYYQQPGGPGLPEAGIEIAKQDQILPYFVSTRLSAYHGLLGLLVAGLFAATMSTMDSGINGVTSVIVYDWLSDRNLPLLVSRVLTGILGATVILAALLVPTVGDTVIGIINTIAGTCLGMILAVFLLGMLVPRANLQGILLGMLAGFLCVIYVRVATDIPNWWLGAFAIFPTFFVGLIVSYLFPKPEPAALRGTIYSKFFNRSDSDKT